jgi:hypothetical protein
VWEVFWMTLLPATLGACLEAFDRLARVEIWPGFDPMAYPLVLHSADTVWLVGHPAPPEGFAQVGEVSGHPVTVGGSLPAIAANTAIEFGGVLCAMAAVPTDGEHPDAYARLLVHECFHAYQFGALAGRRPPAPSVFAFMSHYPESDPANNAMARIENEALAAALEGAPGAAATFAAVRRLRWMRHDERLRAYENLLEYTEGTATYSEFRAGRPVTELTEMLRTCNVGGKWAAYRRFYFTGAATALLLDRVSPGWQVRFTTESISLYDLLVDKLASPLPDGEAVLAAEGYPELLAAEERHDAERLREIEGLLAELRQGPGVAVHVRLPEAGADHVGWDPTRMLVVEPGVRLHTRWFAVSWPDGCQVEVKRLCLENRQRCLLTFRLPEPPQVSTDGSFRLAGEHVLGQAPAGTAEQTTDGWLISLM